MRAVIMSDIHGNLPALQAVMAAMPRADVVVVAGDLCLEGPCPAEVLDILSDSGWQLLLGNTDWDIVEPAGNMKRVKLERCRWTAERLGADRVQALADLPLKVDIPGDGSGLMAVHANPLNLHEHLFPTLSEDALRPYVADVGAHILAFGHLHMPYVRPALGHLLVDVSSVGHPKDRDMRAAFTVVTWSRGGQDVRQVRVPYDVERTADLLRSSDMPGAEQQIDDLYAASY